MAYKVLREIRKDLPRFCGRQIAISVNPRVAEMLLAHAHKACAELGRELGREIEIRGLPGLHQEQFEVTALDSGPPVSIPLQWLGFPPEPVEEGASTAESQIEADEPSSAVTPDTTGPADVVADETQPEATPNAKAKPSAEAKPAQSAEAKPTPPPNELEASRETAEEESGESVVALEPAAAEPAREQAPEESTPARAAPERASPESTPAKAAPEAAPPVDDSTAEPPIAASAEAAKSGERLADPASGAEMLDLEQETPILPHPVKVEEP
jgi:hypothetical protein